MCSFIALTHCSLCPLLVAPSSSMLPAGSVSEQQLDVDPLSLRSLLLPHCTSIKFRVKHAVSELLFQLCDEQSQASGAQQLTNLCLCLCLVSRAARTAHSLIRPLRPLTLGCVGCSERVHPLVRARECDWLVGREEAAR